jgi:Ca-activated chloride channel family protein
MRMTTRGSLLGLLVVAGACGGSIGYSPGSSGGSKSGSPSANSGSGSGYSDPSGQPPGGSTATGGRSGSGGASGGAATPGAPPVTMTPPPSNGGDRFSAPGTNPFISTTHNPFSTFGADVDTASYDIFRRDVKLGMIPRPESVRLEEYVNYFAYEYPAPATDAKHPFQISLEAAANVFDRGTTLVRVGIQAVKPPPFQKRPANVVFLMDVSGSMLSPDKLPLAKQIALGAITELDPTDKISLVTYAGHVAVHLPPTPASQVATISTAILNLEAGGSTAGAAGLDLAYQQAQAGFIEGGINHIILCTDGDFNVGPSSNTELLKIIREKRKTGVTLTALGFGIGNLNDAMMEAVSNAGNGMYSFIGDGDQAIRYGKERLLATIDHVAKDLKIQVEFNPAKVAAYRLLGYEDRLIDSRDFRNDLIDAGEVGAGHRVTALYELLPAGASLPAKPGQPPIQDGAPSSLKPEIGVNDLMLVKVRYKATTATETTPAFEVSTPLDALHVEETLGGASADLQWAAAIAAFAEILKQSPFADKSFLPQIGQIVEAQVTRDRDRLEFAQLFAKARIKL